MGTINSLIEVFHLNESFFIYLTFFFLFLFLISRFLLTPYLHAFLKRDEKTQGRLLLTSQIQTENENLIQEYNQKLIQFNQKFQQKLGEKKEELSQKNQSAIDQTRKEIEQWVQEQKKTFQNDFNKAQQEIKTQAPKLAEELSSKLVL